MTIYRWPPQLGLRQQRWSVIDPVQRSRSLLTGKPYTSRHARRRRVVDLEVAIRAAHGCGVMEGLIASLEGGVNFVRLDWYAPTDVTGSRGAGTVWDVDWDVDWSNITGVPQVSDPPGILLSGLAASQLVARAGEFVKYGGEVRRLIADVTSSASGSAVALLDAAFTPGAAGPVEMPAQGTGIFEVLQMPEVPWTWSGEGNVTWRMAEVFTDEIGAQTELAPWGY